MSGKNTKQKAEKREIVGYYLSSEYYGADPSKQVFTLRDGRLSKVAINIEAKKIYKKGSLEFEAIELRSESVRKRFFRPVYDVVSESSEDTK